MNDKTSDLRDSDSRKEGLDFHLTFHVSCPKCKINKYVRVTQPSTLCTIKSIYSSAPKDPDEGGREGEGGLDRDEDVDVDVEKLLDIKYGGL
ncbi:predicted protein [Sclerotinia sclerotiorum 1980 UF-70]|uniref:Uncharacterized protein n=1 Tax=Sclerotinia sclerotiorum (strain ATCC 18683 / 1980 / Ss-1) TaxID=665079 RepID=A7EIL0_SCLS1|nr:predicted protein [Sclerotinia sclerotiorum 1980 UF-70]EDO02676.1 predicted protein [Sclerotinia sclerotiorum 1980 UF-70]